MDDSIKTKNLNIRTTEGEYKRIQEFAKFQGQTMSGFILALVRSHIETWEDIQDYKKSMAEDEPKYSLDEVKERLEL